MTLSAKNVTGNDIKIKASLLNQKCNLRIKMYVNCGHSGKERNTLFAASFRVFDAISMKNSVIYPFASSSLVHLALEFGRMSWDNRM